MRRLELDGLRRVYGDVTVLDDVSLTIEPGEQLALLGPSGSGKSTLMRLIAGLDDPDGGDIRFDGASQLGIPPHRRDVAMVFQQYALYPHLTVLKNITTGLRHGQSLPAPEATTRAHEVLQMLGLENFASRKPAQLSGGQRQRVGLARALARRAGIVLLDEPLSGLDAQLRLSLRAEISLNLRNTGATVVHVTHDQADAMAGADRLAIVESGRLRQIGTPEQLYQTPVDLFTARFLGVPPMNTYPLTSHDHGRIGSPFGDHPVTDSTIDAGWLGVRPERMRLDARGPWTASGIMTGSELTGADYVAYLEVDGQVSAVRSAERPPAVGTIVPISFDPSVAHLFARDTEQRIGSGDLLSTPLGATPLSSAPLASSAGAIR
jgi:multiple sugar transport system ATP-binding protein